MAVDLQQTFQSITSGGASVLVWAMIIIVVMLVLLLIGGLVFWWWWAKKRYNLRIEIKMPRSDGKIIMGEWGKGLFNSKRGVIYIKRKKIRAVPMKVVDIRRYLQGADLITVIQMGPEDFRPILPDSWTEHIVEYEGENGELIEQKESVLNIKIDTGLNKPWMSTWNSAAKKAYSLVSFIQQFQTPIAIAIVVIAVFIGISILWVRLPTICG